MGILNKIDFKEIDLTKEIINYKKMEKLTLQDCFKYPNATIVRFLSTLHTGTKKYSLLEFVNTNFVIRTGHGKSEISISDCKLILRPLSSLTDEEKGRLNLLERRFPKMDDTSETFRKHYQKQSDYLRSINIDIDNLQEKGVAVYE